MPRENKAAIQVKILILWEQEGKHQAEISVTLGASEIASLKPVLFQLRLV